MVLLTWYHNSWLAATTFYWYWIPAITCMVFHLYKFYELAQSDIARRHRNDQAVNSRPWNYNPELTMGVIVGYSLLSFIPIANIAVAVVRVFPKVFGKVMDFMEWFLNLPIVPRRRP